VEFRRLKEATMKLMTCVLSALALMLWIASSAQAQPFSETFVSHTGNDGNSCTGASPCQTFPQAFSQTVVNGQINSLDSGNYFPITIDKSMTIDCHGVFGGVLHGAINGIQIPFDSFGGGDTRKTVRLRNLSLYSTGTGLGGIRITGAATGTTVVIEDCVIEGNFGGTGRGISDERSGGGKLIVINTMIRNNAGAGISVLPAGGSSNIQVLLNNVRAYNNGTGAQFGNLTRVMIDQSAFTANAGAGILTVAGAIVDVDRSTMSHNGNGVQAAGGVIALANSNIKLNTTQGLNVSGGTVVSFGNNRIAFNASPGTAPSPAGSVSNDLGQQ
jgi:hypothetical protein